MFANLELETLGFEADSFRTAISSDILCCHRTKEINLAGLSLSAMASPSIGYNISHHFSRADGGSFLTSCAIIAGFFRHSELSRSLRSFRALRMAL